MIISFNKKIFKKFLKKNFKKLTSGTFEGQRTFLNKEILNLQVQMFMKIKKKIVSSTRRFTFKLFDEIKNKYTSLYNNGIPVTG